MKTKNIGQVTYVILGDILCGLVMVGVSNFRFECEQFR